MSIILEALKKAGKKEIDIAAQTTKSPSKSESELKNLEVQTSAKPNASYLLSPTLMAAIIILAGGFLLSIIFGKYDISKTKHLKSKIEISPSKLVATPILAPEGYAPPKPAPKQEVVPFTIFKPKIFNTRLTLNGIIYGLGKPAAIIENKILEEGGSIKGAKVVKIYDDRVELLDEFSGDSFILKLH